MNKLDDTAVVVAPSSGVWIGSGSPKVSEMSGRQHRLSFSRLHLNPSAGDGQRLSATATRGIMNRLVAGVQVWHLQLTAHSMLSRGGRRQATNLLF